VNGKTEYWGNSYGYDAWGNLLQKSVTKCSAENLSVVALANNRLSGYSYDAAGNMTNDGLGHAFTFDAESRIAQVNSGAVNYTYDGDGNRVRKDVSGQASTEYFYFGGNIIAESNSTSGWTNYVFLGGERVARKDSTGVAYYFSDHLKTASVITDAAGVIKAESDYYPWGGEIQFVANDSNHYKFTGKERDSETQLDYFEARYYSNGLGRFVTPDWAVKVAALPYAEFADPQSLNLYTYVRNIPTSRADIDGHCPDGGCPVPPKSLAELDKQNQDQKDLGIGGLKGLANLSISTENMFLSMGESANSPFPLFQPSNEMQAMGMLMGTVVGTVGSLQSVSIAESTASTLTRVADNAVETVGPGKGAAYGTQVHATNSHL
jgi:RHS repeat-associated protein